MTDKTDREIMRQALDAVYKPPLEKGRQAVLRGRTVKLSDREMLINAAGVAAASPPDIEALRQELDAALSDWNSLVKASGSPTHGGAVGYVANLRRENERLTKLFGTHPDGTNT